MKKLKTVLIFGSIIIAAGILVGCTTKKSEKLPSEDYSVTIDDKKYSIPFKLMDLTKNQVTVYGDQGGIDLLVPDETFYNVIAQALNQDLFTIDVKTMNNAETNMNDALVIGLELKSYDNNLSTALIGGDLKLNQATIDDVINKYGKGFEVESGNLDKPNEYLVIDYTSGGKDIVFTFDEGKLRGFEIELND